MTRYAVVLLVLVLALPARGDSLRLGWTAWSDAEVMSRLAMTVINRHTDHRVERVLADIGIQYSGIASGDLDFMLMSWQPHTHRDYLNKFAGQFDDLGVLYKGATLGWAVPGYVPVSQLRSLQDLGKPAIQRKLGWRIQGVDPGAGLMRLSEAALAAYGLDEYQLQYASGAGMAVALTRAMDRHHWIVITAWRPHWIFGKHELRFLDDPKRVFGDNESIHVIAKLGFRKAYPRVAAVLSRMGLSLAELELIMLEGEEGGYAAAVERFIADNPEKIQDWLGARRQAWP